MIRRPNGIVLVTGPTGCGKTTTLYAALAEVRDPGEKLITTEDPVEYELDGIQQVNINESVGLTFARCLRSILRQDPDKVLVGEIRDVETAQIAVQAALTGHLVFSTLHTNSAAATVTRLLDMGMEPFLITSSMEGIIGQRLLRTVCQNCKREYMPNEESLRDYGASLEEIREQNITFFRGDGCPECSHTGYHGRMGIFELMDFDDEIRELVLERATTDEIHEVAVHHGMQTMREDGWIKACMGLTTLGEVTRQTPTEARDLQVKSTSIPIAEHEKEKLPEPKQALPKPQPLLDQQTMGVSQEEATRPEAQP
jgi:type II secretory ATPase GspE/PulE/Tfp pilus assembly ATPase PilB-like protein